MGGTLPWVARHWKIVFVAAPPSYWPSGKGYVGRLSRTTLRAMLGRGVMLQQRSALNASGRSRIYWFLV